MLQGVFAEDRQIAYRADGVDLDPVLEERLDSSLDHFFTALARRPKPLVPHELNDRLVNARWSI